MENLPKIKFTGQNFYIWKHLTSGQAISPMMAVRKYSITRLAARIFDIRSHLERNASEYEVVDLNASEKKGVGKYAIYYLQRKGECVEAN
jgi:hypothetical protein